MKTNLKAIYDHPGMRPLHDAIGMQDHRTLVLWALETGKEILEIYNSAFPQDPRPTQALEAANAWSRGEIKMPIAKKAAQQTHEAARDAKFAKGKLETDDTKFDAAIAAAHAMGQIIGVVHVGTHSTAYASYAIQAKVFSITHKDPEEVLAETAIDLKNQLLLWAAAEKDNRAWATFL